MTNDPLYQMNPQGRFSDRAKDYAKYRPSYPAEAIDCILEELGTPSKLIAADIGAGTGISSRLLADRGVKVMAIEPNAAMRQVAEAHPLVEFRDGSAENTQLPNNSVDIVTCFQSFHWFNPEPTLIEFARILKPQGKLAAIWNNRDQRSWHCRDQAKPAAYGDRADQFTAEYSHLTEIFSNNQSELRYRTEEFIRENSLFSTVNQLVFPSQQALDRDSLIGRVMSTSYILKTRQVIEELTIKLRELYDQYCDNENLVYLKYNTSVYLSYLLTSTNQPN